MSGFFYFRINAHAMSMADGAVKEGFPFLWCTNKVPCVLIAVLKPLAQFFWHRTFIIIVVQIPFAIFFYLQITFDFNDISYVGRLWCPEMIPDIEKFLPVTDLFTPTFLPYLLHFFTVKIHRTFEPVEIEQCWICAVLWQPFWKWWSVEIFQCQESIRDIIIYPHMKWCWNQTMLNLWGIGGQSPILRGSKGVGVTIESYEKVEISYINVDNF
jgi:hypothetical protein